MFDHALVFYGTSIIRYKNSLFDSMSSHEAQSNLVIDYDHDRLF
jgi:hypothetical protein